MKSETGRGGGVACQDPPGTLEALTASAEHAAEGAHERIRTLIADDSAVCRQVVGLLLAKLPQVQVVGTAEDGVDALALVASTRPDLVLMDLQMPRLNGLQATRQIRAEFPAVRVIMTTFDNSQERRVNDYDPMESIRSEVREELPSRNIPEPNVSQLCAYEPAS